MADDTSDNQSTSGKINVGGKLDMVDNKASKKSFKPIFAKESTVVISVKNKKEVTAGKVIKLIKEELGEDSILSCIPKNGDDYEV